MLRAPENLSGLLQKLEKQSQQSPDDISLLMRLARLHIKNSAIEQARLVYEKVLQADKNNVLAMIELSDCLVRLKQLNEAVFLLERAQEIRPGYYGIFLGFSRLYEAKKDTTNQVGFLMRAANAAPEKPEIRISLAELLTRYGDYSSAAGQYHQIVKESPKNERALFGLGTLLMKRDELSSAIKCFRDILSVNPGAFDAHFNLANCLFRQKKFGMAIGHFRFAGRKRELAERSFYLSARCYLEMADFDRAIVAMESLVDLDDTNIAYRKSLAEIYSAAGETDMAKDCWHQLTRLVPERPEFHVKYAETLMLREELERAKKALDTLFRNHPGHVEGHRLLGEIYLREGAFKAAIEELKRTLMINENYPVVYLNLASVYNKTGQLDQEYQALIRAVELGCETPDALMRLGRIENRLKKPASMDRFKRITELVPNSDEALEAQYYLRHQAA
jgi:tetratricopeptide (TPR) repeat protein